MSPKLARSRPRVVLRASIGTCSNKSIAARDSPSAFPSTPRMLHPLNDIDRKKERRKRIYDQLKFFLSSYHDETTYKCNIALCMSNRALHLLRRSSMKQLRCKACFKNSMSNITSLIYPQLQLHTHLCGVHIYFVKR